MEDLTPIEVFNHSSFFGRMASTYLQCFREWVIKSPMSSVLSMLPSSPLSLDSYSYFITQLKPLCTDLIEALNNLTNTELIDELLPQTTNRRPYMLMAGHLIPPGLLILLRLLHGYVIGSNSNEDDLLIERPIVLARGRVLIELYASNGFDLLNTILQVGFFQ